MQKSDDATKNSDDAEKKKKELLQSKRLKMLKITSVAPSIGQIKTFQQRAWSSEEFQIALHERVGDIVIEMKKMRLIDKEDEKTIYHRIHQRDPDIIKTIIEIRDHTNMPSCLTLPALERLIDALKKPSRAADVKPFLSARLPFKRTSRKRCAHILQVPTGVPGTGDEEHIFNVPLIRYFVENVWKLERPNLILSVTGGASDLDLPPKDNEMLIRGIMESTRKLKPWSVPIYGCTSFLSVCVVQHGCCVRCCVRLCQRALAAENV